MKKIILSITSIIGMATANAQNPDYLFMIEQAVKAPSGHNTQPWLFKLNDDNIQILPNYDKALPVVDPHNRELFISLGYAAENLCIAASQKGYATDPVISENGIITILLTEDCTNEPDRLFDRIAVRQTNRGVYTGRLISPDTIGLLEQVYKASPVNAYFYKNGSAEYDIIEDYIIAGNIIQMRDKAFTDELKSWMRYNKKHQNETSDGLSYAVFGAPDLPRFIARPIISGHIKEKTQNKGDRKKIASSSHFILLCTPGNTPQEWIRLGMVMERMLLKATELGLAHAYMNQPVEIDDLSGGMAVAFNYPDEHPAILLRIGYGEKMPYSKRKHIDEVIITEG